MYPCNCSPVPGSVTTSPCPSGNCLEIASFTIAGATSTLPCEGGEVIIDIGTLSNTEACTGNVLWIVDGFDATIFDSVEISNLGVVTGTLTGEGVIGTVYEIVGRAICDNSLLSGHFKIKFLFKDICATSVCAEGETCDKCFGCVPTAPNLTLE